MTLVQIETEFDQPAVPVTVPAKISAGFGDKVRIVDGVLRSERAVGRVSMSPALVGIKLIGGGRPLRVTIRLALDNASANYLNGRNQLPAATITPYDTRELVIRSQGVTRGAVVLGRRPSDFTFATSATFGFDLGPDEVDDDGLLIIELAEVVRGSFAAMGVRFDTIEIVPAPAAAPAPTGVVRAGQLVARGLASTGVPAVKERATLTSPAFVADPRGTTPTWTLRSYLVRTMVPDPLRKNPGPLMRPRPTGAAAPRVREKAVALGRRKADEAQFKARQRLRHLVMRSFAFLFLTPVAWLLAPIWFRTGRITATVEPVTGLAPTGEEPRVCEVRRMSLRRIAVTPPVAFDGPVVVRLKARRFLGFTPGWKLNSARYGAAER
jgi:hypothetical protein